MKNYVVHSNGRQLHLFLFWYLLILMQMERWVHKTYLESQSKTALQHLFTNKHKMAPHSLSEKRCYLCTQLFSVATKLKVLPWTATKVYLKKIQARSIETILASESLIMPEKLYTDAFPHLLTLKKKTPQIKE